MNYIPISKNLIPYSFDIKLGGETFTLAINYNATTDFFTVDLTKGDEILAVGEKIVYGRPLFSSYVDERFPNVAIIPYDLSEQETAVGWRQLQESVFLFIITQEDWEEVA